MHDGIRELGKARTLDDLLEETAALTGDGARVGRRRLTYGGPTANAAEVVQRAVHRADEDVILDGWTGRPVAKLPIGISPGKSDAKVVRHVPAVTKAGDPSKARPVLGELVAVYADDAIADDHLKTPDEIDAERAARIAQDDDPEAWQALSREERQRRDDAAIQVAARGKKRVHGRSGSDKGPKAKRRSGEPGEPISSEIWDDKRGGKVRPVVVGARVTSESKDTLDADQSVSNGEVMETVAIVMRKTGKSKAEVLAAIERISETGMVDPDVADAMPTPANGAAA